MEPASSEGDSGYRLLFDANPQPMWVYDRETLAFLAVNDAALEQYGYTRDELLGLTLIDIRPPEDVPTFRTMMETAGPEGRTDRVRHRRKDGSLLDVEVTGRPITFEGRAARLVVAVDVTEWRRSEAQLLFLAENVEDVIFRVTLRPTLKMDYVSGGVARLTGYSVDEYYADPYLSLRTVHPDDEPLVASALEAREESPAPLIIRVICKNGSVIWTEQRMRTLDDGDTIVGVARDVTDRVHLEEQLRMLALDDDLTGLRNRRGFIVFGNQLLSLLQRGGRRASLLFLDVDQLKQINDMEGHAAGDAALVEVGRALRETLRDSDVVARIGGDEFAVLMGGDGNVDADGEGALERLRRDLGGRRGGRGISVSGGIVHWDPSEPASVEELMIAADRLMYRDKGRAGGHGQEPGGAERGMRRRVLIVDDIPEMRLMMRLALEREVVEVVGEAGNGAEAMRLAETLHPDVVLLDLRMPGTDGFDAIPTLRAVAPDAVIVVVTVLPPGPDTDRALALGAHHCLRKNDLRSVVELVGAIS